jgi:hypothetical protein
MNVISAMPRISAAFASACGRCGILQSSCRIAFPIPGRFAPFAAGKRKYMHRKAVAFSFRRVSPARVQKSAACANITNASFFPIIIPLKNDLTIILS